MAAPFGTVNGQRVSLRPSPLAAFVDALPTSPPLRDIFAELARLGMLGLIERGDDHLLSVILSAAKIILPLSKVAREVRRDVVLPKEKPIPWQTEEPRSFGYGASETEQACR